MKTYEPRVELLKVVGRQLDKLYCLVNVERGVEDFIGSIWEWNGNTWTAIYRDEQTFFVDILLLDNNQLLVACGNGHLVQIQNGHPRIVAIPKVREFMLSGYRPDHVLLAGVAIYVMNTLTSSMTKLYESRIRWAAVNAVSDGLPTYIAGVRGKVECVVDNTVSLIETPFTENLTAIHFYDGILIVGGWHGFVQRQRIPGGEWEDISIQTDEPVTSLVVRGSDLVASAKGIYVFDERTGDWRCEVAPTECVFHLSSIGGQILACHTYTSQLSRWQDGIWISDYPPIL